MKYLNMIDGAAQSSGVYDKTKLSTFGNVSQRTLSGKTCYGPGLTKFINVQTDFSAIPITLSGFEHTTTNNRKFIASTVTGGIISIALYTVDTVTGSTSAIGRIQAVLPNAAATTHTLRSIRVVDSGVTGWKIFLGTVGSVVVNGGVFLVNNVDLADFNFSPTPNVFYSALSNDIKATYFIQDPTALGVNNSITTLIGFGYASTLNQIISAKGTAASLSHDGFSTNTAPSVLSQTCTAPTVNASPTFTLTAHGYNANDMVVISANAPGGFTASNQTSQQTVYFVRNPLANTFELSATSGGASINATTATTPTIVRAWGTSTNCYVAARKTGTIATGFAGTALLLDNNQIITPADGSNSGILSYFLATSTNFYCWQLTNISSGATTLPTALGVNNTGTGIDYIAPTTVTARYSEQVGKIIYTSASFAVYMKSWVNSNISHSFGSQITTWLENNSSSTAAYFRGNTVTGLSTQMGWVYITINTTGQRGILAIDVRSDNSFNYSYMISPVRFVGPSIAKFISTYEKLFNITDSAEFSYRTAQTSSDPIFATDVSGTWTLISTADDLSSITLQNYVQIKVTWDVATFLSGIPTQIYELLIGYDSLTDNSMNWYPSVDGSTQASGSPSDTVWELRTAYSTTVPTLYSYDFDKSTFSAVGSVLNTSSNPTNFNYSTDGGTTWLPLGTIPNVVGTRIRRRRSSPPGVDVITSLRES